MLLPFVREFFADVEQSGPFARLVSQLKSAAAARDGGDGAGAGRMSVSGLTPTAKALVLALLQRALDRPLMVIVPSNRAAEELLPLTRSFCELSGGAEASAVALLPAHDVLPFENLSPHPEIQETRAVTLWKLVTGGASMVIVPAAAAAMRMRAGEHYAGLARRLRRGEAVEVDALIEHLNTVGYTGGGVNVVEMPGQYARRGGILDVFSPEQERPLRLEFFGDDLESIRSFEVASQRSRQECDEAILLPLVETPVAEATLGAIHARLSGRRIAGRREPVEQAVAQGGVSVFPGWEFFAPLAGEGASIFDLAKKPLVISDEPALMEGELAAWWQRVGEAHERSGVGNLARPEEIYFSPRELEAQVNARPGVRLEQLGIFPSHLSPATSPGASGRRARAAAGSGKTTRRAGQANEISESHASEEALRVGRAANEAEASIEFHSQPTRRFHGNLPEMSEELRKLAAAGTRVMLCLPNFGEVERMAEVLGEYGVRYRMGSRGGKTAAFADEASEYMAQGEVGAALLARAFVPDGTALPELKLAIFGALDLFDESEAVAAAPAQRKSRSAAFLSDFRDLAAGDYVVHVEHGIGQYLGLKEISQGDEPAQEFMVLEYAEGAKLYVPLTRLDLTQKYRSAEGAKPALSRLGTAAWAKTKARVKKAMQDMAAELLKLYAERKTAEGFGFSADGQWQREFEDAFEFSETEDQLEATKDIKRDMEAAQPMDRLLCGDVGYGKTEVAMRAAFKAVSDNKQVAVLAPTTVLAFQHYETFKQRFAAFPITVEMLSRFRSPRQQKEIMERTEGGKVDVLIGTHRLLSRDLKFADLGLVVVDEEQRFGVRHKERLKQLKKEVDVLTMSATPIPRTLHMSMVGLRDMSMIETPPKDRLAIQTMVANFDDNLIRRAIEHELERGGQAYFVHNRVDSIYEIAAKIQQLAPRARVTVGHGQMSEGELEKVMLKFIRHEADVLVATTIIENGLDIPLCNTIIVNRADRHGLSELYQLRGRVGRSNRRAYAYLLVPAEAELTPLARRRLAALKEFSDLGAGFKIAALDLELRGAGSLLGGQQSGHIDAVGFEMYTSMIDRAVRELKGEGAPAEAEAQLNLGLNIRVPAEYIGEENQRLRIYKRVAGAESEEQLAEIRGELQDRYGEPPAAVENLFEYARLRLLGRALGVMAIDRKRDQLSIKFNPEAAVDGARLAQFVAQEKDAQFSPAGVLSFSERERGAEKVLGRLREVLEGLAAPIPIAD